MNIVEMALKSGKLDRDPSSKEEEFSPFSLAAKEAFEALKNDDLNAFSEAFEAAVEMKAAK